MFNCTAKARDRESPWQEVIHPIAASCRRLYFAPCCPLIREGKMFKNVSVSRRRILAGAAAFATMASVPRLGVAAGPAKYRRWNISDPNCPPRVIESYKKAIRAMLALPATDP